MFDVREGEKLGVQAGAGLWYAQLAVIIVRLNSFVCEVDLVVGGARWEMLPSTGSWLCGLTKQVSSRY